MVYKINVSDFLSSGELSPLSLGITKAEVIKLLGHPSAWGSKKNYKVAYTWDYFQNASGILSVSFNPSHSEEDFLFDHKVCHISIKVPAKGYSLVPEPLQLNNQILNTDTTLQEFEELLTILGLSYQESASYTDGAGANIYIKQKSVATFDESLKLYSLATHSQLIDAIKSQLPQRKKQDL